ncbi:hypothetical protein P3S68_003103 [Capsicum galapagoense]
MGSIPFTVFNISSIEIIAFTGNSLSGNLPNGLFNCLPILKKLYLSGNKLVGHMPTSLSNGSQLKILSLSKNEFDGPIHSEIGRLSSLQQLYLGIIPQEIGNLANLMELSMEVNQITGSVPISIFNISVLQVLSQWGNNINGLLPRDIGNLTKMQFLYLQENRFSGEIPNEISNLVELEKLNLQFNSFSGSLEMEIFNISRLRVISLSHNNLSGSLPPTMGSILPNIEELNLGSLTSLVGTIPHSISNCSELAILELSNNQITGLIPNSIGYLTYLQYLNLALNNLTTDSSLRFLTFFTNCVNLTALSLTLNPPNGMLPASTGNLSTSLKNFYANVCKIKVNYLVGSIPKSIGNLRNLQGLFLSNNKLTGSISDNLCKLHFLDVIDLTQNNFSRSLPYCLGKITSLREIRMGSNKLSTNIPPSLGNIQDLVVLDLSSNNMVGSLPLGIGNLKTVTLINLSMNQFSNRILREIAGFQKLAHLSLRHNKLQGTIPDSMSNIVGEIPSGGPFKNLSSQFFIYNEAFCGSSRFSVPPCPTSSKNIANTKKFLVLFLLLAIAIVFVPMAFVLLWIRYRRGKSAPQQAESFSTVTRERISYYALLQATDYHRESNLIGFGSFVSVYKGVLRNGTAIAVNVFNLKLDVAFKSFDTECEVLHSLRHRNLMYLYSHNYFLDIKQRLRIMIDVACALEYLHHGYSLPVIHCDVKPSNILLDEDMVAHLSDFGISKLLGEGQGDFYTKTLATFGYIAPEYGLEGLVSTKCDIYSYGVMLLETFTRRKPSEFEGDRSLKQWASYSLPDAVMEVGDANLLTSTGNRLKKELDVVASIMKVALDCCNESPTRRTNMKDVVGMLPKIKIQLLAC